MDFIVFFLFFVEICRFKGYIQNLMGCCFEKTKIFDWYDMGGMKFPLNGFL